ncbi:ABC transporter permease [Tellurirhabdus bombi]|uniref:ABC transporter permease n=1 Tax=Tellurirhabdus bombi TaxID=2907205 RepID=UPI001F37191C|nr:ABC transporter permease [Tellurirhabdus bombi]
MLQNYFKIAWRNLWRNRLLTTINVTGLALGLACALLIGLWVNDELSFNRSYKNLDSLYAVKLVYADGQAGDNTSGPLAEALKEKVPGIEKATKMTVWDNQFLIKVGQKSGKETGNYVSDDFFEVFQLNALQGSPSRALQSPNQIVISRKLAMTYFNTVQAVGQRLQLNGDKTYVVGAVIEDIPQNTSVHLDWFVNFKVQEEDYMRNWDNIMFKTYVRLNPAATQEGAERAMKTLLAQNSSDKTSRAILQPLKDVYLYSDYANGKPVGGRIDYLNVYGLVAIFILLIACVNFMNLATARASMRAKEVGVRKVVGAMRSSLVNQFMGESLLVSFVAGILAVLIAWLMLPTINAVFQKNLVLDGTDLKLWGSGLALVILTGLVAGSYPAFFLSSMKPVQVLKGVFKSNRNGAGTFRQSLVVIQFSLSILLIISMLVVGRQMAYVRTKHLGLSRENVLYLPVEGELRSKMEAFRQELLRTNAISAVTATGELPINIGSSASGQLQWPGKDPTTIESIWHMWIGYDFVKTMNVQLAGGRDFDPTSPADQANYLINESAAKLMALKNPVGQPITYQSKKGQIIGVMKDFHMSSLHEPIKPLIFRLKPDWTNFVLVKTAPGQTVEAIQALEQTVRKFNPDYPFEYHFLNENYEKLYHSETLVNTLVNYFGGLAILISCLGLFGLAAFTAERRTKEIGVRKVLGASAGSIVALLSRDFLKLVFVALLIATPLAWYFMDRWLQDFAYRVELSWWMFVLAGGMAMLIALATVSFQSLKAALVNPVKSLKSE